ncbi:MAG: hypothetical protein QF749_05645 [Verrucomicrobiota bacterium]|jgi:hypothetical protein|nr:hypothetical protein [Verrucomicrobiota bacterium]MDP7177760.1 hypothetical protein [Verrucomicrobiota bacterium]MDP7291488.1 hypothetical protein [Verrucomicrobiota bacterium]
MKPFEQDSTGSGYLMMSIGIKLLFACLTTMTEVTTLASSFTEQLQAEWEHQYRTLEQDMGRRDQCASYAHQTAHPSSLILDSDRDPVDIVLRRTSSLLQDIQSMSGKHRLDRLETSLDRLRTRGTETVPRDGNARFELFVEICSLRRTIALSNPLLNFNKLLFIKRHRASFNHMCDQYYGVNAVSGGGIFVLENPWGNHPRATNLLADTTVQRGRLKGRKLTEGSFLSPDLSYDGTRIVFAYVECGKDTAHRMHTDPSRGHWSEERSYHLFKVHSDGEGLEQLTDGTWNDFDPCWLPNGRVAFISERRGGYLRCGRVCPTYTLYDMEPDGSDIRCLSPHETNEWHPSVNQDGMIVYTRWDYVDRHGCTAHLPWVTTQDGRDARAIHGNFAPREHRPDMELDIRAVPGSNKYVATAAPHHGQAFGSIVLVDPSVKDDDAMSPVTRLTPEVAFPETQGGAQVYGSPWPLSETYHLCVYDADMRSDMGSQSHGYVPGNYGIYLVDAFGNKELLYRDPDIACLNPMPLRARTTPASPPSASERLLPGASREGTLAVVNVYDSHLPWPKNTKIESLRVFQIVPMSVPSGNPPHEIGMRLPTGLDSVILARYILGTVPVEEDGSAYFKAPAQKELFFQLLDQDGLAVQSMRSSTYLQPGENLTCQGCHEPKSQAPEIPKSSPRAFNRAPSTIEPSFDGTNPFSYPRLVQPVLERHCLKCHSEHPETAPRLDREVVALGRKKWFASYHSLAPKYGFWQYGNRHRTLPGKFGARASKLYNLLQEGHYDVDLPEEDMERIVLWLDACSIFYGVYEQEGGEAQLRGEIVRPTLE